MRRLLCRLRRHPLTDDAVINTCDCGHTWLVHIETDEDVTVMRIRAANTDDPRLAAALTGVADWIEAEEDDE